MIKLKPHQIECRDKALAILKRYGLVYLVMQTRTGKTFTSLSVTQNYGAEVILFITKKKSIKDITSQCNCFPMDCDVINWESVHKLPPKRYDLVIIDEGHQFGGFPKKPAGVEKLQPYTSGLPVIFLSASPTPESETTLYWTLELADNSPWRRYRDAGQWQFYRWADDYVEKYQMSYTGGHKITKYDKAIHKKIEADFAKYRVNMTQKDAGIVMDIKESILRCPMSSYTHTLYDLIRKSNWFYAVNNDIAVVAEKAVQELGKCHQICGGTIKTGKTKAIIFDRTKAYSICYDADERGISKFAVYYKFVTERKLLAKVFKERGYVIHDDSYDFENSNKGIFMSQFVSGREGIKLSTTDVIYMYGIDFAWLSYEQTKNRIQSFERTTVPELVWVFSDLGLEDEILKTVRRKKKFTTRHYRAMR